MRQKSHGAEALAGEGEVWGKLAFFLWLATLDSPWTTNWETSKKRHGIIWWNQTSRISRLWWRNCDSELHNIWQYGNLVEAWVCRERHGFLTHGGDGDKAVTPALTADPGGAAQTPNQHWQPDPEEPPTAETNIGALALQRTTQGCDWHRGAWEGHRESKLEPASRQKTSSDCTPRALPTLHIVNLAGQLVPAVSSLCLVYRFSHFLHTRFLSTLHC